MGWSQTSPEFEPLPQEPIQTQVPTKVISINQVPPQPQGLGIYVNDWADLLTEAEKAALQERLKALDEADITQIAVVTLPNTQRELAEFAPEIIRKWGIGHKASNDGVLILVNAERVRKNLSGNRIFLATGYGIEEKIPDAVAGRILDEQALPLFQAGNYSQGIIQTALTVGQLLQGDQALEKHYKSKEFGLPEWIFIGFILLILFLGRFHRRGYWSSGGGFSSYGGDYSGGSDFGGGFGGGDSGGGGAGR